MNKGCLTWFYVSVVLMVVFVVGLILAIKIGFGPSHRTVSIDLGNGKTLIGEETYNADLADVFFDVNFTLHLKGEDTLKLGNATFHNENWNENIKLTKLGEWFILAANTGKHSKLLLKNRKNGVSKDTILDPIELRYDSLWSEMHNEIPVYFHTGSSTIDSLRNNRIFIKYNYRIGYSKNFNLYTQSVEYELDSVTGDFITMKVFERK